ncbi:MAG: O-antigen ligase family protein [Acidobacteriota bacterium]
MLRLRIGRREYASSPSVGWWFARGAILVISLLWLCVYLQDYDGRPVLLVPLGFTVVLAGLVRFSWALALFAGAFFWFHPDTSSSQILLLCLAVLFVIDQIRRKPVCGLTQLDLTVMGFAGVVLLASAHKLVELHSLPLGVLKTFILCSIADTHGYDRLDPFIWLAAARDFLSACLLYWIVSRSVVDSRQRTLLLGGLGISFILMLVYCLVGVWMKDSRIIVLDQWHGLNGILTDRNSMAALLTYMLGFFLGLALSVSGVWMRLASTVLCSICIILVALTVSLTGMISCALVLGLGLILLMSRFGSEWRTWTLSGRHLKGLAIGLLLTLLVCGVIAGVSLDADWYQIFRQRMASIQPASFVARFYEARGVAWKVAAEATRQHPWTGLGPGMLFRTFPEIRDELRIPVEAFWFERENAHNYFLQLSAEIGLPGAFLFIACCAVAASALFRRQRRESGSGVDKVVARIVILGWGGLVLTCLSSHPLLVFELSFLFWVSLALTRSLDKDPVSHHCSRVWLPVLTLIGVGWLAVLISVLASPTPRFSYGLHSLEQTADGKFRWTKQTAVDRVRRAGNIISFSVRSDHPAVDEGGFCSRITMGDLHVPLRMVSHRWYPVALPVFEDYVNLVFQSESHWNPSPNSRTQDDRELAVAVSEYVWRKDDLFALPGASFLEPEDWQSQGFWRWMHQGGQIILCNFAGQERLGRLTLTVKPLRLPLRLQVNTAENRLIHERTICTVTERIDVDLRIKPGRSACILQSGNPPEPIGVFLHNQDTRWVTLAVQDVRLLSLEPKMQSAAVIPVLP